MSKRTAVTAFTSGRNIIYGKTLPENETKKVEVKKMKSILIKKNKQVGQGE